MSERVSHRGPEARRNTELLAAELDTFLQNRPAANWDFAAAPSIYQAVIENLSTGYAWQVEASRAEDHGQPACRRGARSLCRGGKLVADGCDLPGCERQSARSDVGIAEIRRSECIRSNAQLFLRVL